MNPRFERHALISDWNQERLSHSAVIIIGMGALGNEVARMLAMAGVGCLILCDPDVVADSNLSRMILFGPADVGQLKVEVAAKKLRELYPDTHVEIRPLPLVHGVGLAELRDVKLVLGCLDSRAARLQLAGRCQLVGAKYIDGGTHPWGGEVRLYLDPDGPCYGCSLSESDRAYGDVPWSCMDHSTENPVGAAIPSSALVGTWMGMFSVRYLMGLTCPKGTLRIDGVRGTSVIVEEKRDPNCLLHTTIPAEEVISIQVHNKNSLRHFRSLLPKGAVPLLWEPVKERQECPACGIILFPWTPGACYFPRCPRCNGPWRVSTTLELNRAPMDSDLESLGIPNSEIIAVRLKPGKIRWYELQDRPI